MPVLGRGDDDAVDVFVVKGAAHIENALRPKPADRLEMAGDLFAALVVDFADVLELYVLDALHLPRQVAAASAGADESEDNLVVRRLRFRWAGGGESGGAEEKVAAGQWIHARLLSRGPASCFQRVYITFAGH